MKFLKTTVLALSMIAGSVATYAQSAEEIVAKHIEAIGGADKWKAITAMKATGAISMQGMDIPVGITIVQKKGWRLDLTIMGMNNYQIITDKEGWVYFPVQQQQKPEPMTAEQVKESQDQLDIQGEFIDYKTKGKKIEFVGKDDMEGTEVLKVKVTDKDGTEKTVFFDPASYYVLREVQKIKADGKEDESIVSFSNYKKLSEGIVYPMTIESPQGPVTFSSVEINPKIDASVFSPSDAPKAEEKLAKPGN